jgi:hypothetical protein
MFRIKYGLKLSLGDFIIKATFLNLFADNWIWECHFSVSVIRIPRKFVSDVQATAVLLKVTEGFIRKCGLL